jgi:ADP-ribose pyrophosphatase
VIITEQDVTRANGRITVTNPAWRDHNVTLADAEIAQTEVLADGPKRFIREVLVMPDGTKIDWLYVDTPASVLVIPVMADGKFVMVLQYRHNLKRHVREFPAGEVAPGETLEVALKRELAEETGFALAEGGTMRQLGSFYSLPSETNKITHVFLAEPVVKTGRARQDDEIERYFGMSVQITAPGLAMAEVGKSIGGTETITALMLARDAMGRE